jgi:hypothetical protein
MAHQDAGKYAAKHPPGAEPNARIAEGIRQKSSDGKLACAMGEKVAKELQVGIPEVGMTADLMEIKIKECQLGLFGWGEKPSHGKDIRAAETVPVEIKSALEKAVVNGGIACATLWAIADRLGAGRKVVSTACETLGIKIRSCQLGTF